ncbi:MAG: flagellin [bacterium]
MAINDISLTSGMRANLISLQGAVNLLNRTQERLATGKKVNTALDNPIAYFSSRANMSRANDISVLKDGMSEAIQTIKAADSGIRGISDLIEAAKALAKSALGASKNQIKIQFTEVTADIDTITIGGTTYTAVSSNADPTSQFIVADNISSTITNLAALINANEETSDDMTATASGSTLILQAKSNSTAVTEAADFVTIPAGAEILTDTDGRNVFSERRILAQQYNDLMTQINATANSSGYRGVNLLMDNDLNVAFESSALSIRGFNATASDLQLSTEATTTGGGAGWGWTLDSDITLDLGKVDIALATLRSESSRMSSYLSIINIQEEFAKNMINTLTEGADKITLADMNEEGANMLMLQTRQALGTTALSLSAQSSQSVLRLF